MRVVYERTRWFTLVSWWLDDIENLVVLCSKCHNKKIHGWDEKLRNFYRDSFTEPDTMMNILFQKPNKELF